MIRVSCAWCKSEVRIFPKRLKASKSGLVFCNRVCKESAQSIHGGIKQIQPSHYGTGTGISKYRDWALKAYGEVCIGCGYHEEVKMLDVDHIDGNRFNNNLSNLQVLCVWCHALKTRLGLSFNGRTVVLHSTNEVSITSFSTILERAR